MDITQSTIESSDLFEHRINFSIDSGAVLSAVSKFQNLFKIVKPKFYLHANDVACFETSSFDELEFELKTIREDFETSDVLMLKFVLDKTLLDNEIVFSPSHYLQNIPSHPRGVIEYWSSIANSKKGLGYIYQNDLRTINFPEVNSIRLDQIYNNVDFDKALNISPDFFFELSEAVENNDVLRNYFQSAQSIFSLKLICSGFKQERETSYSFEGYNRVVFNSPTQEELVKSSDVLYTIFQWSFSDNKIPVKLGILRNIVSLTNDKKITECFNHNLLTTLFSNYQIYLKDNVKEYIEVKNKLSEFIFDLSDKAIEAYEKYEAASRNATLAVVTYFFTVVILRVLSKAPLEKIFNIEIAAITTVFVLAALIHIFMLRGDLRKKNKHLESRMEELKSRYENIFSNEEKEELFKSKSLSKLIEENENSRYHINFVVVLGLIWLIVSAFAMSNLGVFGFLQNKIAFFLS